MAEFNQGMEGADGFGVNLPSTGEYEDPRDSMMKKYMRYQQMFGAGAGMRGGGMLNSPMAGGSLQGGFASGLQSGMGTVAQMAALKGMIK
jgi:hypothetical protein